MNTEDFWKGEFGDEYTKRNRVDWQRRVPFWKNIILTTGARSVLEFGCGAGWNLSAITRAFPDVALEGIEINDVAAEETREAAFPVWGGWSCPEHDLGKFDLVFTAGVLIHIHPDRLKPTMTEIVNHSRDYVLAIEYHNKKVKALDYRGNKGKLWAGDYGTIYTKLFPDLELVSEGSVKKPQGFDDCQFWLFRK